MPERRLLPALFAAVLALKLLLLALDHTPGFQFGDSASYLQTALTGWIPPDRSFVYGFLLRPCLALHSLQPLVVVQVLLSTISAWLAGFCLHRYWNATRPVIALATLACALDPLQLMFERFVMTEAVATFGFALLVTVFLEYGKSRRSALLFATSLIAAALVSVRFSFLPLATLVPLFVPLVARQPLRRTLTHMTLLALTMQTLLFGYRHLYGHLSGNPPAYLSQDGYFLLADVSPLIIPADMPLPEKRSAIFQHLALTPANRLQNRWSPDGLCSLLAAAVNNNERLSNRVARATALSAIKRNPLGVLGLGAHTYLDFFHSARIRYGLLTDQGQLVDASPETRHTIEDRFRISLTKERFDTLTRRWELHAAPWCWLVLLSPLLVTGAALARRSASPADAFALVCSWLLLAGAVLPTELANPRYLLPLTWLTCMTLPALFVRNPKATA